MSLMNMMPRDLGQLYLAESIALTEDTEAPPALRAQVHETLRLLMTLDSDIVEDVTEEMDEEASFEDVSSFEPEHIFSEQIGAIYFDEAPPSFQVLTFRIRGVPSFSLTRILVPADGNPVGCYFLGDSTTYASWAGEYYGPWSFVSRMLNDLVVFMGQSGFDAQGQTVTEILRAAPDGDFAQYCRARESIGSIVDRLIGG